MSPTPLPRRFGPFLLLSGLGTGGTGEVHLARRIDPSDDPDPLVIKRLHPRLLEGDGPLMRFRHEAEIAVRVDSPHVAKLLDAGMVGEQPYIAIEYVHGLPLVAVLKAIAASASALSTNIASRMIVDALEGLAALHEIEDRVTGESLEFVHRDLSPRNLMIADDGRVVLIDLGLGRSTLQEWRTQTGAVMGSLGYMAPEQVSGEKVDQRADLYVMGVLLWELLAGRPYVRRGSRPDAFAFMANPVYQPIAPGREDVSPELEAVCRTALARHPEDRFTSARAFSSALSTAASPAPRTPLSALLDAERLTDLEDRRGRLEAAELAMQSASGTQTEPPEAKTVVWAARATSPGVEPEIAKTESEAAPIAQSPPSTPRVRVLAPSTRSVPGGLLLPAALLVAIGFFAGRHLRPAPSAPAPMPSAPPPTALVPLPIVTAREVVAPLDEAPLEAPAPKARPTAERPTTKKAPVEVEPDPAPVAPPPPADPTQRLAQISARAGELRKAHPEHAARIDRILMDVSLVVRGRDVDKANEAIAEAERALLQLSSP